METLIDKKTFKTQNHYKTKNVKTQIIIANSLRKNSNHLIRLKNRDFGMSKTWPTFTVTREGVIFQHFNEKYHSDFIGIKSVDIHGITIVLENMGWLRKIDDVYYSWVNEICDKEHVINKKTLGYEYWEKYSEKQMKSLSMLCDYLCDKNNIIKSVIDFHYYHADIKKYKGIVLRSNHIKDSTETNPILNLDKIKKYFTK